MNLLITDFETTGLDPLVHEIVDIGAILCDAESLDICAEFQCRVKPEHPELCSTIAAAVNGYNEKDWVNAVNLDEAFNGFRTIASQAVFTAHNVCFDYGFYTAALRKLNLKCNMNYHRLDVGSMGFPLIQPYLLSLDKIRLVLGINPEPAPHTGIQGARAEYEVLKRFREMAARGIHLIEPEIRARFMEAA